MLCSCHLSWELTPIFTIERMWTHTHKWVFDSLTSRNMLLCNATACNLCVHTNMLLLSYENRDIPYDLECLNYLIYYESFFQVRMSPKVTKERLSYTSGDKGGQNKHIHVHKTYTQSYREISFKCQSLYIHKL